MLVVVGFCYNVAALSTFRCVTLFFFCCANLWGCLLVDLVCLGFGYLLFDSACA